MLLLADILQEFRSVCLKHYELDPAHYVSAPQLAWDAMLKHTKVKLDLVTDPAMYEFVTAGMRGGICMISKRFARANHADLGATLHDPAKPDKTITYIDANNLYGWAMSQDLPISQFAWLDQGKLDRLQADPKHFLETIPSNRGCILEVDLEYPQELHNSHNDYPLAPEKLNIQQNWLSETQLQIRTHYHMRGHEHNYKLLPHFFKRTKYVCTRRLSSFILLPE